MCPKYKKKITCSIRARHFVTTCRVKPWHMRLGMRFPTRFQIQKVPCSTHLRCFVAIHRLAGREIIITNEIITNYLKTLLPFQFLLTSRGCGRSVHGKTPVRGRQAAGFVRKIASKGINGTMITNTQRRKTCAHRRGVYSTGIWVGGFGRLNETLTLFKTQKM